MRRSHLSPGFIDGHTHMDAQIFWDPLGTCSCWHGLHQSSWGNCGFHPRSMCGKGQTPRLHEPGAGRGTSRPTPWEAGIPWTGNLSSIHGRGREAAQGHHYATYVGHSAMPAYVMGDGR